MVTGAKFYIRFFLPLVIIYSVSFLSPAFALLEWTPTNGPWGGHVVCITISKNSTIYVGTLGAGVYRSTDGGETWQLKSAGFADSSKMINSISVGYGEDPADEHVFVGTEGNAVYKSTNGGDYWASVWPGLEDFAIRAIDRKSVV